MTLYFIILIVSIICHELGHLLMALFWKVKVHACSFGFGKVLLHKKWKNIDWRISLIPLGGYCDIEENLNKPNSLYSISYWKQLTIILAGVSVNFLIAFICYLINYHSIKTGLIIDWLLLKSFVIKDYSILLFLSSTNINLFLLQCGFINITLAIGNLIMIPPLDGGLLWLILLKEKISAKIYKIINIIGLILVILIQVIILMYIF